MQTHFRFICPIGRFHYFPKLIQLNACRSFYTEISSSLCARLSSPRANVPKPSTRQLKKKYEPINELNSHGKCNKLNLVDETAPTTASSESSDSPASDLNERVSIQDFMWHPHGGVRSQTRDIVSEKLSCYLRLGKYRLSALVVSTTTCGFILASAGHLLEVSTLLTMAACCGGTFLTSLAANSINQLLEVPYDSQMQRTHSRPIVTGRITSQEAALVAVGLSVSGLGLLGLAVNPVTMGLGAINLLLYTAVYTPMKRLSQWNTWVGSIVGAIPPLMGWAAGTHGALDPAAWVLFALLYAWQFPHFMALSWNLKGEYSRAGYQMTSTVNPDRCRRVALRHSVFTIPICLTAPYFGLTDWMFAAYSLPFNVGLAFLAWRFYRNRDSRSSRRLFQYTLAYLPVIMALMIISRKPRQQTAPLAQSSSSEIPCQNSIVSNI